jgi:hypothetical protein
MEMGEAVAVMGNEETKLGFRRPEEVRHTPLRLKTEDGRPRCLVEATSQTVWTYRTHLFLITGLIFLILEVVFNWPIPKK